MAIRLHSNWAYLEQEFGCSIRDRFLMAIRSLDNPKAVTPFLLENGARRHALFLHVEKGNVEAARIPGDIAPVYYRPYFTFDPLVAAGAAWPSLADATDAVAEGERAILIDPAAPLTVVGELRQGFTVTLEDAPAPATVTMVEVACADTVRRLGRGRPEAARAAGRLLEKSPWRDRLRPYLGAHDEVRFSSLDKAIGAAGLAGIVVSSTLNVQEIAGVPVGRKHRPLAALYIPGSGRTWVMEPGCASGGRQFPSPKAALDQFISGGVIGVEADDIGLGLAHSLGLDEREWRSSDALIRQWRDESTLADLPYYIIASRTTRCAIEAAFSFVSDVLKRGARATELDGYAHYLRAMREFVPAVLPGLRVARTLTNFHCGSRTIFPANPAAQQLDGTINTFKIDAGCLLFDADGFLLGCSDIARTIALSDEGRELYALFEDGIRRHLIPGARAGRAGGEMHAEATDAVWSQRTRLSENSLFVDLDNPGPEYDRDVGHLLGKNNLAHLRFIHQERRLLKEGMIACCEYQWPLKGHAIAYEDTCLVTPGGGLNITSDDA